MKLVKAEIVNFRSIKDITIDFSPECIILVGINESGKSNILRALSLLSETSSISGSDIREIHPDEDFDRESYVKFYFDFEENEVDELISTVKESVFGDENFIVLKKNSKNIKLKNICKEYGNGVHYVDIKNNNRTDKYYSLDDEEYTVPDGLVITTTSCPNNYQTNTKKGQEVTISPNQIIKLRDFPEIPENFHQNLELSKINEIIGNAVLSILKENKPEVMTWKYSEDNLLPDRIDLAQFTSNPSSCTVLKHMFTLAGIDDIPLEIKNVQSRGLTAFKNLLNRVARKSTEHLQNVWKEKDYKTIKFELSQNANHIDASIMDEFNTFPMKSRSDGFKQFATFLLMISARVDKDDLSGSIILIDEPEGSLHPSGCRYLRDELIRISKKNLIVYSTHSIFMIDKNLLERHLIVKKNKEITDIKKVTTSNYVNEEVLYNALHHSIFWELKKQNIVFEGWRDKKLFDTALKRTPRKYPSLKEFFKTFGSTYVRGVKQIECFTPLLALAERGCLIISDSDKPAKEKQKKHKEEIGYGYWYTYDDIISDVCITSEDFIKSNILKRYVDEIKTEKSIQDELQITDFNSTDGKLKVIDSWLSRNDINDTDKKDILKNLKEKISKNLTQPQIEEKYYKMLEQLKIKIEEETKTMQ